MKGHIRIAGNELEDHMAKSVTLLIYTIQKMSKIYTKNNLGNSYTSSVNEIKQFFKRARNINYNQKHTTIYQNFSPFNVIEMLKENEYLCPVWTKFKN